QCGLATQHRYLFQLIDLGGLERGQPHLAPPAVDIGVAPAAGPEFTRMTVGGSFRMREAAIVCVGCDFAAGASLPVVVLEGDFDNQSRYPSQFDWTGGGLRFRGIAEKTFEVASRDLGPTFEGFATTQNSPPDTGPHTNFSMEKLEVETGASVRFVNAQVNTAAAGACAEALYVHQLVLQPGSTITLSRVRVYYRSLLDNGGAIVEEGCGELVPLCAAAPPAGGFTVKNRFLTFTAGTPGRNLGVRVTFTDLPGGHSALNGRSMWVDQPQPVSEKGGLITPELGDVTFHAATLSCQPLFTDWTVFGAVNIFHEAIVPEGQYMLQVIDESCSASVEGNFSAALPLAAGQWGDVVGGFDPVGRFWTDPDGIVEITSDVISIVDKFANRVGAPAKARVDLEPDPPDLLINITDAVQALDAFRGKPVPFSVPPIPCP
ncbi:MAG: hypothetical protein ACE5EX_06915, partial [Phycisphaerae bacterium]